MQRWRRTASAAGTDRGRGVRVLRIAGELPGPSRGREDGGEPPYGGGGGAPERSGGCQRPFLDVLGGTSGSLRVTGSPRIDERAPGRGTGTPGIGPPKPDRAALLWADSRAVTLDPAHPARLWAARRHLWRPGDPWPDAVRWLLWRDGGGSMVAAFAPVADWTEAPPPPPPGVQLVHVAADGSPRKGRGGLNKRNHGPTAAAVAVIGAPLWRAECVHVAEGLADALAVAAREDGAALAVGGASGFGRLAPDLAALAEEAAKAAEAFDEAKRAALSGDWPATRAEGRQGSRSRRTGPADRGGRRRVRSSRLLPGW